MSNSRTSFVVVGDWQLHQILKFPDLFIVEAVLLIDEFSKGAKAYEAESIPSQSAIQCCGSRPKGRRFHASCEVNWRNGHSGTWGKKFIAKK